MAFLPCPPPPHRGHRVSELLGNCWKVPENRSRIASPKPPMGMAPGDARRQEAEAWGSLRIGGWDHGGGNGPPARFAMSSPVF